MDRNIRGHANLGVLAVIVTIILSCAIFVSGAEVPTAAPAPPAVQLAPAAPVATPATPTVVPPVAKIPMIARLLTPSQEWLSYYDGAPQDTSTLCYDVYWLLAVVQQQQRVIKTLTAQVAELEKRLPAVEVAVPTYDGEPKEEPEKK